MREHEKIYKTENPFKDQRGTINNYELPEKINLVAVIDSIKGCIRANHYHPTQEQKCILIKGKYISVTKDLLNENEDVQTRIINQGDLSVIPPNVAHTMIFLEDSLFLNLVNGEREHENYGNTHTIPHVLVNDEYKNKLIKKYAQDN
jgi:dTDP-4-dehydrorhamnose 3,5-epimerase-like enzyme